MSAQRKDDSDLRHELLICGGGGDEGNVLRQRFFQRDVVEVARSLIGARLLIAGVGGMIVETEAYHSQDPASHSFSGKTPRNASMFGEAGRAYVYRSYGLHWCLNFVCGAEPGAAVLIRALAPTHGIEIMISRRRITNHLKLCAGPGRLCEALAIDHTFDGLRLDSPPFEITRAMKSPELVVGARIGISKGMESQLRFGMAGSRYVSRRFATDASPV